MPKFVLDERLAGDTLFLAELKICNLLLMNDQRWPWLILVPRLAGVSEWHDVSNERRLAIDREIVMISRLLKEETAAHKINVAMLGNIVSQLHIHVVARNHGDPNWPNPVWGYQTKQPYTEAAARSMRQRVLDRINDED